MTNESLPDPEDKSQSEAPIATATASPPACLLLITGDPAVAGPLGTALAARGRQVLTCTSEAESLAILARDTIDAIIIDLLLPGYDGRRLITRFRSDPLTAALPIVALGAAPSGVGSPDGLVNEPDLYFPKPIAPEAVADRVGSLLKRAHRRGRKSYRDALTGLLNRAALCEAFDDTVTDCAAAGEPFALAILGLHPFDAWEQEGDGTAVNDVIRQVGSALSACLRTSDIVARWRLTEFAIILPGEDQAGATRALEKVLDALYRVEWRLPRETVVRFCTGLAIVSGPTALAAAVGEAERQLFEAYSRARAGQAPDAAPADAGAGEHHAERIALCVGDTTMGRALVQMLEREHFVVTVVHTADKAVTELSQTRHHLLIADDTLALAGLPPLLERLRDVPRCNTLRIIVLVTNEAGIKRAMELGANDYMIKPPDIASLLSQVRRILVARKVLSRRFTVMIVDHELPQLMIAGTTLARQCGCNVLLAKGARDALQRLATTTPDYLMLDMGLTDMPVEDLLPKLVAFKDVTIIPATASATAAANLRHPVLRIVGRLTRPYRPTTLIQELKDIAPFSAESTARDTSAEAIDGEIRRVLTLP